MQHGLGPWLQFCTLLPTHVCVYETSLARNQVNGGKHHLESLSCVMQPLFNGIHEWTEKKSMDQLIGNQSVDVTAVSYTIHVRLIFCGLIYLIVCVWSYKTLHPIFTFDPELCWKPYIVISVSSILYLFDGILYYFPGHQMSFQTTLLVWPF